MGDSDRQQTATSVGGFVSSVIYDIVTSPLNCGLLVICVVLIYNIATSNKKKPPVVERKVLPKMKKKDMTLEELAKYDGSNEEGRVLVSVCGKIFDVSFSGKKFYGPGGPYEVFAGRDASRALATFSLDGSALRTEYDDLSDLRSDQMSSLKEWELQFSATLTDYEKQMVWYQQDNATPYVSRDSVLIVAYEKYIQVGKLLKPGETPTHYSDEEDEDEASTKSGPSKSSGTREKTE